MTMLNYKRTLICLFILGVAIDISLSQMDRHTFETFIEPRCYDFLNNEELIYGQEYPLAHTLENFLNLLEKYELANPDMSMKDITVMLLRNYTYENMVKRDDFVENFVDGINAGNLIAYRKMKIPNQQISENNPFNDDEICSLFFMLSHTINDIAWPFEKWYMAQSSETNGQSRTERRNEHPKEQGVIAIKMGNRAVAIGRVIFSIYLSLLGESVDKLTDISVDKGTIPPELQNVAVDPFYFFAINDLLAAVSWNLKSATKIGPNGKWETVQNSKVGVHFNTTDICPNVYRLPEKNTYFYTYSSLRGAVDGVILGNMFRQNSDLSNKKLSQILRMYYSRRGISIPQPKQEVLSFCKRTELIRSYNDAIKNEIKNAIYVLSSSYSESKVNPKVEAAHSNFESYLNNNEIVKATDGSDPEDFCESQSSPRDIESLKCDTPSDVIAVLDTQNGEKFIQNQQIILGYLANNLRLWHQGSRLTVLLDGRNDTTQLELQSLLVDSTCSPCAACHLIHQTIGKSNNQNTPRDIIIQSIDKFLQDIKKEEKDLNAAAGKVLLYFNFDDTYTASSRETRVLRDLYLTHLDTTIYALGKDREILSQFSRNILENAILATEPDLKKVADDLSDRICAKPAALKYEDCLAPRNERTAVYEGLITPNSLQHWVMDPKYFEKSYTAKIFIELDDSTGDIDVYHNRADVPEHFEKLRKQLNSSVHKLTYEHMNPCKGFSEVSCSPMMFSLVGRDKDTVADATSVEATRLCEDRLDSKCKRLDQIRFKISHEGIRCSGCSGLSATVLSMVMSVILAFIMS